MDAWEQWSAHGPTPTEIPHSRALEWLWRVCDWANHALHCLKVDCTALVDSPPNQEVLADDYEKLLLAHIEPGVRPPPTHPPTHPPTRLPTKRCWQMIMRSSCSHTSSPGYVLLPPTHPPMESSTSIHPPALLPPTHPPTHPPLPQRSSNPPSRPNGSVPSSKKGIPSASSPVTLFLLPPTPSPSTTTSTPSKEKKERVGGWVGPPVSAAPQENSRWTLRSRVSPTPSSSPPSAST